MKKIQSLSILWYIEALAFLFPEGFAVYFSGYKRVETLFLYFAIVLATLRIIYVYILSNKKIDFNLGLVFILLYHLALLIITLKIQGHISEGLKLIFSVPVICVLLDYDCRNNLEIVIDAFTKIITIIFLLNILIFNQWFFKAYFLVDNHILFIGHVQIASQLGLLGIFVGYIRQKYLKEKHSELLLICLSIVTMLYSQTSASYLTIGILCMLWLLKNNTLIKKVIISQINLIVLVFILLSVYSIFNDWGTKSLDFFRLSNTLTSGRVNIWMAGLDLFKQSPLIGYGIYGFKIVTFWSQWTGNPLGMSYAHSTLLQLLLDGGIILAIIFILIVFSYIEKVKNSLLNNNCKYLIFGLLIAFLFVGLFESLTQYCYIFMFLTMMPCMENIESCMIQNNIRNV